MEDKELCYYLFGSGRKGCIEVRKWIVAGSVSPCQPVAGIDGGMQAELQNEFTSLFISTWIYEIFPCLLPIFGKENVY